MRGIFICLALSTLTLAAPLNLEPTQDASSPKLALDSQNRPYVAWVEKTDGVYLAFVQRWNGHAWVRLGSALNLNPKYSVAQVSLALSKQDQPFVAWGERPISPAGKSLGPGKMYVAKWTGSSWQRIGPSPSQANDTVADNPILRLDSSVYPVLVWSELPADTATTHSQIENVYVARWNGQRWLTLDGGSLTLDVSLSARSRDLGLNQRDEPLMVWSEQVLDKDFNVFAGPWGGRHWVKMGGSLNRNQGRYASAPALALDSSDYPLVAFTEADKGFDVWVKRWNGKGWYTLGQSLNNRSGGARNPRMVLGPGNNPVVAGADNLGNDQLFVKHWDGKSWQTYGDILNINPKANVFSYDLQVSSQGNPVVVWSEEIGSIRHVFLKRCDEVGWAELEPQVR